jgi:hypothetical protein
MQTTKAQEAGSTWGTCDFYAVELWKRLFDLRMWRGRSTNSIADDGLGTVRSPLHEAHSG